MGSLVEDNTINSLNNQISGGSRSSILLSKVEFKNIEDDNDMMSTKTLQTKYNVLTNDNKFSFNNNINSNELVIKMNGQNKICSNNSLMNGNTSDNSNDGIPVPKHVLFPHERVLLDWKESRPIGAGLTNLGNTCFLNSVLQCLTYCPPLVNYILHSNDHNSNKCNNQNNFCMICEMSRHLRQTRNHCGEAIKPINICRRLKSIAKHFTFGRQEDAHEFLRYVIDNMWKSSLNNDIQNQKLDPLSKETTAINQIFGGYHRSQVICLQCKAKSNTYDYFMDFMLDIKNVSSLEKALDKFVAPEILQHEEAYKCTRCKRKVLAKKLFTVFKAPNVATFQFKRFDYNRMFGGKLTKPISYPEKLDLRPYMSDNKGPPILYKLNSVLVHLGPTCNSGHYFCYVRNSNNSWYLMDDSRVIQTNQNSALNQGQAYVLFYVRIDTDFHRPTPMKNFISQTTPNGIKLSNISSPELSFRNQKLNNFGTINNSFTSAQTIRKLNSPNDALKAIPSDVIKQTQNSQRKQNDCEKNNNQIKGLVPYATDSSDDESPKSTNHLNGSLNSNCDKNLNNSKLSTNELNSNQSQKNSSKAENEENSLPNVKTNSNQTIPNPKPKISINFQQNLTNHTSESSSCVPLAPITLKVKATTPSSWHVVETALRSPSIASNSSTNSVNSTTEWTVSDCKPDCNGKQHSKHKHKNKQNRCLSTANGNVTQFLSTKEKLPQNGRQINQFNSGPKNGISEPSTQISEVHNKFESSRNQSPKKCSDNETNISVNFSIETIELKFKDNCGQQRADHFDRKSVSSHRSSNDSQRDDKRRSKERDRSHSKSIHSDESTCSAHKREKRKSKSSPRKSSESDSKEEKITIKIKHKKKKKKLKKQKHKKRDRSDSESDQSEDNQLQWIERTKETVEKERNCDSNKSKDCSHVAETVLTSPVIASNSSTNNIFVRKWDQNVRDLAKKRSLEEDIGSERTNNQMTCNNNAVNELLKNGRGFGDKVNSWNGEPSTIELSLNEDKRQNNDLYDDDYDEEFDRGKTKKVKTHKNERFYDSTHNPFQKLQSERHRFNGSFSSHPNKPEFDRHFKGNNNNHITNHKSWNTYHKRHDKERRH